MATKADIVIVRFDPEGFAKWLTNAYENSKFKSITKLASAVGSNKATMSRIMNAAPQTLTGKPTRVQPEMVKKLATVLNADIEEGLRLAGFPIYDKNIERPKNIPDFFEGLERLGIEVEFASDGNFDNYTPEDLENLKEQIAAITSAKQKRVANR